MNETYRLIQQSQGVIRIGREQVAQSKALIADARRIIATIMPDMLNG